MDVHHTTRVCHHTGWKFCTDIGSQDTEVVVELVKAKAHLDLQDKVCIP